MTHAMMSGLLTTTKIFFAPDDGTGGAPDAGGNDTQPAAGGVDTLIGGQGQDTITPAGNDTAPAGGTDTLAAVGNDTIASPWGEIDADLKEFAGDKSPADVLKELKGAQSLLGKKQGVPGKDATPEEWATFHETRGVPKESGGYEFDAVRDDLLKDIPEADREAAWDKDEEARFRGIAKSANLSQAEASKLLAEELGHRMAANAETLKAEATTGRATQDMITEQWGPKADEYTQDANNFMRHFGLEGEAIEGLKKMAGSNAEARFKLLEHMRTQGAQLREGGQGTNSTAIPAGGLTPEAARMAKTDYLNQGENMKAYNDAGHPNHKVVEAQVTQYLKAERGIK